MKKLIFVFTVLTQFSTLFSQNSFIENSDFESTSWPKRAWMNYSNTGIDLLVNDNEPTFTSIGVQARSGNHFAYIGGVQNVQGEYEGSLAQEFQITSSGHGTLTFYYRYIRESVDPGSYIQMLIDGNVVWELAPHFIVDATDEYIQVEINTGFIDAGTHTLELKGYEFPLGGDLPMQFAFDDVSFTTTSYTSMENQKPDLISITGTENSILFISDINFENPVAINIYDTQGKSIISKQVNFNYTASIEKPTVPSGIYIISVYANQQLFTKKVFLQ